MENETLTVPATEDAVVEPAVTETQQPAQAAPEPQTVVASPEVEAGSKEPQAPERQRPKPSDYYRERQRIRDLEKTIAQLSKWKEESESAKNKKEPAVPEVPDYDPNHFSPEHKRILSAREQALRSNYDAKISALEQKLYSMEEGKTVAESERKNQEALEKLFPKTSPDSKESLQERIAKDPERAMRIKEFLVESGLNEFSKINPDLAVEIALEKLGEKPKPNPTVLKKALMGSNGSGNPGVGSNKGSNEADLLAEKNKLNTQLELNPSLRGDPKFIEQRTRVLEALEKLVTKK